MPNRSEVSRTSTVFAILACFAVVAVLYFASEMLIPFALAILFTFILAPLVNRLERLRLGRVLSVLVVVALAFVVIAVVAAVVFFQVISLAEQIPQYADNIKEKVKVVIPGRESIFGKFSRAAEQVNQSIEEAAEEVADEEADKAGDSQAPQTLPATSPAEPVPVQVTSSDDSYEILKSTQPVLHLVGNAAVITVLVIFMLLERRSLRERVIVLAGQSRLNLTTVALEEAGRRISRYLLMQLLVNFLYGLPVGIGLWLLGLPNAFLWGLIAMFVRFIPYVGPWIGAIAPIMLALAIFDDWSRPLMVIGMFVILELVVNNALEPRLYGSQAGVSPLALLAATVFWTWLWGSVGLLLAVPMTVCVVVIARFVPPLSFLNALLTDQPQLSDEARFHQMLLTLDFDDAFEIAEKNCHDQSLLDTYDRIVLPALHQVEKDRHAETIDEERVQAVRRGLGLLILELSECATADGETIHPIPDDSQLVLCVPARDEADELAARMLCQVLRQRAIRAEAVPVGHLTSEVIDLLTQREPGAICVSAVPPSAVSQARHICARVIEHQPELPMVVGIWDVQQVDRVGRRLPISETVQVVSTLAEAVQAIARLAAATDVLPAGAVAQGSRR